MRRCGRGSSRISYAPEIQLRGVAVAAPATALAELLDDDEDTSGGKVLLALGNSAGNAGGEIGEQALNPLVELRPGLDLGEERGEIDRGDRRPRTAPTGWSGRADIEPFEPDVAVDALAGRLHLVRQLFAMGNQAAVQLGFPDQHNAQRNQPLGGFDADRPHLFFDELEQGRLARLAGGIDAEGEPAGAIDDQPLDGGHLAIGDRHQHRPFWPLLAHVAALDIAGKHDVRPGLQHLELVDMA